MPCIETKTNVPIGAEKEKILKEKLGKAISLLPGKSESWLMLTFEENCHIYFRGKGEEKLAYVEVSVFGSAPGEAYERLTREITDILSNELGIPSDGVYVKYSETQHWGWNGGNF